MNILFLAIYISLALGALIKMYCYCEVRNKKYLILALLTPILLMIILPIVILIKNKTKWYSLIIDWLYIISLFPLNITILGMYCKKCENDGISFNDNIDYLYNWFEKYNI